MAEENRQGASPKPGEQPKPATTGPSLGTYVLRGIAIGAGTLIGGPVLGAAIAVATSSGDGGDGGDVGG